MSNEKADSKSVPLRNSKTIPPQSGKTPMKDVVKPSPPPAPPPKK